MSAWPTFRRIGTTAALLLAAVALADTRATAAPEPKVKPTPAELKAAAEKAEKAGDWEAAFNLYCHLFVADRGNADVRERLNVALRHTQQLRRHRDPGFQQFANGLTFDAGLDLFAEVMRRVPAVYADRDKASVSNLWGHAIEELDRALGDSAFRAAFLDAPDIEKVQQFRVALRQHWAKRPVADAKDARIAMRRLILAAREQFAVRVPAALAVEAASGACSGLDEYTVFLAPSIPTDAVPDLTTSGLYLGLAKDGLVVEGIAPHSWVALTYPQLRRGDRITYLNGRKMDAPTAPGLVAALKAHTDGSHQLDVRGAADEVKLELRVPVVVPSVYGTRMLPDKPVGYVRIGHFQASTPRELDAAIGTLKIAGAQALVIDLRGNHGGSFLAGVETARRLLPHGLIVTTQGQVSEVANQTFSSSSGMSAHSIPVVLLIDADTASAAEVLAAALKDNNRAVLVGMPSFGKGSVQHAMRLVALDDLDPSTGKPTAKSGTVRITIAKLVAPTGAPISGVGVGPHVVEPSPSLQLQLAAEKAEELAAGTLMPGPMVP